MTDELPDLTPYLNKRGGNAQGRGDENPAGKTDISSKLSALVKKPGSTGTHPSVQAALSSLPQGQSPVEGGVPPSNDESEADDGAASIGIIRPPAPAVVPDHQGAEPGAGSNGQDPTPPAPSAEMDSAARWGALAGYNQTSVSGASSSISNSPSNSTTGSSSSAGNPAAGNPATGSPAASGSASDIAQQSAVPRVNVPSPPAVPRPDDGYSQSLSRDMTKPNLAQDKLKAPQSKPMSTLSSSSAPPLLKTPPKTPGRPAQPYNYKQGIEPIREGVAPRGPSPAPLNRGPQPVAAPKPAMPQPPAVSAPSGLQSGPYTDGGAQPQSRPPAQPRPESSSSMPQSQAPMQSSGQSSPQSMYQSGQSMSQSQSPSRNQPPYQAPPPPPREETAAERLARAFMEEARALQDTSVSGSAFDEEPPSSSSSTYSESSIQSEARADNYQSQMGGYQLEPTPMPSALPSASAAFEEPPAQSIEQRIENLHPPREAGPKSSLSSLFDSGVLTSRNEPEPPKKGFGSLLGGAPAPDEEHKANTLGDLMIPTGEHNTLFAPDRRDPSGPSAFDEISAQLEQDQAFQDQSEVSQSSQSFGQEPSDSSSLRMDDNPQAPAFGSLFGGSEIATSGQSFSGADGSPGAIDTTGDADSDLLEPFSGQNAPETKIASAKSIAISKLIEAVNQGESKDESRDDFAATSSDAKGDLFSSDIVGSSSSSSPASAAPSAPDYGASTPEQLMPDVGSLSPSALEALAAFVPQQGEEQHETKGLLAKLKAKDAAVKAAQKAEADKKSAEAKNAGSAASAASAPDTRAADARSSGQDTPAAAAPKSSLASLLSGAGASDLTDSKVSSFAPESPKAVPSPPQAPEPAEQDSGSSLGDAISDALDKLLDTDAAASAASEAAAVPAQPKPEEIAPPSMDSFSKPSGLSKLLDDDPDRFNRPIGGGASMIDAEGALEAAITASAADPVVAAQVEESHPLTLTNSKVDALSRLLEVASKAPDKPAEEKPGDSSGGLASMLSQPPGPARPGDSMDNPDLPPREAFTSPFGGGGGTSPFSSPSSFGGAGAQSNQGMAPSSGSPFGSAVNSSNSGVGLGHTPSGGFSSTGQSQPAPPAGFAGTGSMTDMPKAAGIASDAISARIAALNRKLEEQTKGPGSASSTAAPMVAPGQPAANYPPPQMDFPPPPVQAAPAPDFVPNPIVDDSPQTRSELVNRILGSAKISNTALPDAGMRGVPDMPLDQQISQMHLPKGQAQKAGGKSKSRARGGRPGINPLVVMLVLAVIMIGCLGGYVVLKDPHLIKGVDFSNLTNLTKAKTPETKQTVDQVIKNGDIEKAIEMLEAKKESGKFSASEGEKLYGLYYQTADKIFNNDGDPAEAIQQLEKIPKKTKKYKDAQKLLRKLKKKAEKN